MVDELIAERGVRAPFIRLAKEGDVLARDCYLGPAGFGAEMPDQVDSAKVLGQFASGATIVLQGLHRLWPPLIDFVRRAVDDLGHPVQANAYITPPGNRGFDPHYDVHDVFVLQAAGQKRWIVHEPVHDHPLPSQPWTQHRAAIAERVTGDPVIDTVLSPRRCAVSAARMGAFGAGAGDDVDPSDHRRVRPDRRRRRPRGRRSVGDRRRVPEVAADGQPSRPIRMRSSRR